MSIPLCHIDDIPEAGALGIDLPQAKLFAVKQQDKVFVYINRCPHLGVPLNWQPNKFLDPENTYIQCSSHGALFLKENGECILGPCQGQALWQIETILEQGFLSVNPEELPEQSSPR